jgi:HTH-type transcriptional regulator, glycine betaine synthesis regulator
MGLPRVRFESPMILETKIKSETPDDGADTPWDSRGTTGGSVSGGTVPVAQGGREDLEREAIEYFVSFVQMFGLQKSIGQIYGLLFVSLDSLAMDDIIVRLGISKGSASQGLTVLKGLGAVTSHTVPADRREHFRADLNVSRIVTHFFENRLQPRLENGEERLKSMIRLARVVEREGKTGEAGSVLHRIQALQKWQKRGRGIIPLLLKWLKR